MWPLWQPPASIPNHRQRTDRDGWEAHPEALGEELLPHPQSKCEVVISELELWHRCGSWPGFAETPKPVKPRTQPCKGLRDCPQLSYHIGVPDLVEETVHVHLDRLAPVPQHRHWQHGALESSRPIVRQVCANQVCSLLFPPLPQQAGLPLSSPFSLPAVQNAPEERKSGSSGH